MKSVHPFPARMAPGIALERLCDLAPGSRVLDPMAGSGTVLRQASDLGHASIGFDMDPLAVLMARVWTTPVQDDRVGRLHAELVKRSAGASTNSIALRWIDDEPETAKFVTYWFAESQRESLRAIAYSLREMEAELELPADQAALDVLKLNLSRIIVTKEMSASLARDTSHSRPHRVATESQYNVMQGFERSLGTLRSRLKDSPPSGNSSVMIGDARAMLNVGDGEIDVVLTSPPYLNAIDYLRGHRLALVWLGYTIPSLRAIRSASIGAERSPDSEHAEHAFEGIKKALGNLNHLPSRYKNMIERYAEDLSKMMLEIARVTKVNGKAVFVVGNSCLKSEYIQNSEGVRVAAEAAGFKCTDIVERDLPHRMRYLPVTDGALAKRMNREVVLTFEKVAA